MTQFIFIIYLYESILYSITDRVRRDCHYCAYPPDSSYSALILADKMQVELGLNVVGWDLQFEVDYARHQ